MRGRTLVEIDRDECIRLMERHPSGIGRIAVAGPRPNIFPVNFAVDEGSIYFRSDAGSKFDAAVGNEYVAFEVDWVEPTWQAGWSVVVRGQASVVTDEEDLAKAQNLPIWPWAEGDKEHYIRIEPTLVSGRRLE